MADREGLQSVCTRFREIQAKGCITTAQRKETDTQTQIARAQSLKGGE
jgi:hypothetical protein